MPTAKLARRGGRVLVLEQHAVAGGLTPTAEVVAMVDAAAFASWFGPAHAHRPAEYRALKERIAQRLASPALHVRTPLPGLLLAGQDVTSPGVQGAFMGGLMAAATVEPALWRKLGGGGP